ncbi:hypothetical protein QFZ82_006798 [Streptomyces sp. V4I23]|uniref:DUF4247 domain-containing protein n=1 Tax=Streptomyces sp. V4I23 TaxID=3042282 RepID=UPI00277FC3D4|nr:DUF4247 domain-containing protein [Streptomyces sp. V4I23]MDQ1012313.1 hypothetical protein [Streptomyces sp. V4I23]
MKTARLISVTMLATVALTACAGESDDVNDVPRSWIHQEYDGVGPTYTDSLDTPAAVGDEIGGHTAAGDRIEDDGHVFLRYRDDIVAITPHQSGSMIEIDDYRDGHRRWKSRIGNVWPDPDSDAFRGGGPGSGK